MINYKTSKFIYKSLNYLASRKKQTVVRLWNRLQVPKNKVCYFYTTEHSKPDLKEITCFKGHSCSYFK